MAARLAWHVATRPPTGWRTFRLIREYRRAQERLRIAGTPGSAGEQLAEACRRTGTDARAAAELVGEWMDRRPLDLLRGHMREDLVRLLELARSRDVRLAVFSDYPAEAKLAAMGIRQFFDVVRCAQEPEIGAFKPDPRGLRCVVQTLGVDPSRALHVGDRPDVDAAAARAAGLNAAIIGTLSPDPPDASCLYVRTFTELASRLGW